MNIFEQIVLKIVKSQEPIIGPIAWHEAGTIPGVDINAGKNIITINGKGKIEVEMLVNRYRTMFGKTAHRVCIEAAKELIKQLPLHEVPENLKTLELIHSNIEYPGDGKKSDHLVNLTKDLYELNIKKSVLEKELNETNQKLISSNQKLDELNRIKAEFISQSRHNVGTPLTKIKGYLSLIQEGEYGQVSIELKRIIEIIEKSSDSLISTMNEIMGILKVEPNEFVQDKSTHFDMRELCIQVIAEYKLLMVNKKVDLIVNIENKVDYRIAADRKKIQRVLRSIMDNSFKYTEKGYIKIELVLVENMVQLKISDTGIRNSSSVLARVFEKLVKGKDPNELDIVFSDLDLYLAKQIIEDYQGQFNITSSAQGAEFRIQLPGTI